MLPRVKVVRNRDGRVKKPSKPTRSRLSKKGGTRMVTSFWPKQPKELNGSADSTGQGLLVGSVWMQLSRGLRGMDHTAVCANTCNDSPPHPEKLKLIQQYVRITQPGLFWLF